MERQIAPITSGDRIELLDALRGFAIMGILMVNMLWMNSPVAIMFSDFKLWDSQPNHIAEGFIKVFFESKFYVLFSLLFGYGFWMFLNKKTPGDSSVLPVYRRRIFFLLLFGVAHVLLLWPGDILIFYALFGFLLIVFCRSSNRKLIRWAVGFLLIPPVIMSLFAGFVFLAGFSPEAKEAMEASFVERNTAMIEMVRQALQVYAHGTFSEIFFMRLKEYTLILPGIFFFYPNVIAMFLVGFYAARKGYLTNPADHIGFFKKLIVWGILIGLPANIFYGYVSLHSNLNDPGFLSVFTFLAVGFGGPALTFLYISIFVLFRYRVVMKKIFAAFSPVGRMALTNYLMHSIVAVILFHSYGFGLYGKVNIWQGIILTLIIFIVQILLSRLWLNNFRFGPFEWLWRSLTYGKKFAMRKSVI